MGGTNDKEFGETSQNPHELSLVLKYPQTLKTLNLTSLIFNCSQFGQLHTN
jgi:hypothetical protein